MKNILIFTFLSVFSASALTVDSVYDSHWAKPYLETLSEKRFLDFLPDEPYNGQESVDRFFASKMLERFSGEEPVISEEDIESIQGEYTEEIVRINKRYKDVSKDVKSLKSDLTDIKIDTLKKKEAKKAPLFQFDSYLSSKAITNTYDKNGAIPQGSAGTKDGNGPYTNKVNENAQYFSSLLRVHVWMKTEHLGLNLVTQNQDDVWGDTSDDIAAVDVRNLSIWLDKFSPFFKNVTIGRQYLTIARGLILDGAADYTNNGIAVDGFTSNSKILGFDLQNAYIKPSLSSGTRFGAGFVQAQKTLGKFTIQGYWARRSDGNMFDPYIAATYTDVNGNLYPGLGTALLNQTALSRQAFFENVSDVHWFGLAADTVFKSFSCYGEAGIMKYKEEIPDIHDNQWIESVPVQWGTVLGAEGTVFNTALKLSGRYHSKNFRPFLHTGLDTGGQIARNIPGYPDFAAFGYTANFTDIFSHISHNLNKRTKIYGSYEAVAENTAFEGREKDNMKILSAGIDYRFRNKSTFRLWFKNFNIKDFNPGGELSSYSVDSVAGTAGVYDTTDSLNLHDSVWEDHKRLMAEVELKF